MEEIDFMADLPGIESAYHPRVKSVALPQDPFSRNEDGRQGGNRLHRIFRTDVAFGI